MNTKELMVGDPEVSTVTTNGIGKINGVPVNESVIVAEVPDDKRWTLQNNTLMELILTDGSNNHIPADAFVKLRKYKEAWSDAKTLPDAEKRYSNWYGFDIQDQRSDEFRDNTRIQMSVDNGVFQSRSQLIIAVTTTTAVNPNQSDFHLKLPVLEQSTG